ncbi:hypothetical protein Goarm_001359 [Gossypium armourianum]|uniref:Uncharacterized protein n=1 Tax=Gossypium armourianum TaxID=34283 RepID=A0A7J9KCY8_9ROSI|nr:hypothetical protein [Gossypium armourianum]
MRKRDWTRKWKRSTGTPCAAHAERTMLRMSSGFAATYVKSGSMANA